MVWILVGYMWLFIHRPFEIWPIFATIRLERTYMIFTLFAWFMFSAKSWTSNRNNAALFMVASSIFISTLLSSYTDIGSSTTLDRWFKVFVFFLLLMTSITTEKELKIIIAAFSTIFTLYMTHSFREYLCGKGTYAMGIWRMTGVGVSLNDPNSFGASINYALPFLLVLPSIISKWTEKRNRILGYLCIIYSFVMSCICVQRTGSRSAFTVIAASVLFLVLMSKYRMRFILLFIICAPIVWFSLPDTLKDRYRSIYDPSYAPPNAQASAEGRLDGFYGGIEVWKNNLPFGVGPACYQAATGSDIQTHNLIGQVLSELGTFGAIAYTMLWCMYFVNYFESRSLLTRMKAIGREKDVLFLHKVSYAVFWSAILLFVLGLGGHNAFRYTWVWYAAFQGLAIEMMRKKVELATAPNLLRKPMTRFGAQPQVVY